MSKNYVDKNKMMDELKKYNETNEISQELGHMFMEMCKRYTYKLYSQYKFPAHLIDDIIGDALYRCVNKVHLFDTENERANPFAYFTQLIHNQILASLKKERKNFDSINEYREKYWEEYAFHFYLETNETYQLSHKNNADDFI